MSELRVSALAEGWMHPEGSPIAAALAERRARGLGVVDLIGANPHEHGLVFPREKLVEITRMAAERLPAYAPDARGQLGAREAIAGFYGRRGHACDAGELVLTPGTSLAYFYAFRLLCDAGGEILVPRPGYPLFDDIAALCGVKLRSYHLRSTTGGWVLDPEEVAFQVTPSTRAMVVVSPHNPTGQVCDAGTLEALGVVCRRHGLALLFDEVFCEFVSSPLARPRVGEFPLSILLNGFSKMFSLPGHKAGWMAVQGGEAGRFLAALEHVSDTFLPVSELVQGMIPRILETGDPGVSGMLGAEFAVRRRFACEHAPLPTRDPGAGVYVCLELPRGMDENALVLSAVRDAGVLLHPGYFYDMPGHVVMTCVAREDVLAEGLGRLAGVLGG